MAALARVWVCVWLGWSLGSAVGMDGGAGILIFDGATDFVAAQIGVPSRDIGTLSAQLWMRPLQKFRNGHLESCIISQGSWQNRFKVSLLPWHSIRFTFRSDRETVIDCDMANTLQWGHWYHVAFTFDSSQDMTVWLNGIQYPNVCGKSNMRKFRGKLNPSNMQVTLGSCFPEEGDDLYRGNIMDVCLYSGALTHELVAKSIVRLNCSNIDMNQDTEPRLVHHFSSPIAALTLARRTGTSESSFHFLGDGLLAVTLAVAEHKVNSFGKDEIVSLPKELLNLTPDNLDANRAFSSALQRRFHADRDELDTWTSLNEYAIRLESLGHMYAREVTHSHSRTRTSATNNIIALIVPATSKGVSKSKLSELPLINGLLSSLYETAEQGFDYVVYLTVNEQDEIYTEPRLLSKVFQIAEDKCKARSGINLPRVARRLVVVPDTIVPSRTLSGLFNAPTLLAYNEGANYFYLLNDDLTLVTPGWSSMFVDALKANKLFTGLGVAGAVDVSDTVTPQIEFPFFSRVHVSIFIYLGANPWIFKNWWEDNWLTDIYLPFRSVFYFKNITVSNYGGLSRPSGGGSMDPRYTVSQGRRVPPYYVTEVEAGRRRILNHLTDRVEHVKGLPTEPELAYCPPEKKTVKYKHTLGTLSSMASAPHEDVIDPCDPEFTHAIPQHQLEVPHVAYPTVLEGIKRPAVKVDGSDSHLKPHPNRDADTKANIVSTDVPRRQDVLQDCDVRENGVCISSDSSVTDILTAETEKSSTSTMLEKYNQLKQQVEEFSEFADKPMRKGQLCKDDSRKLRSCFLPPLRILILHHHIPLVSRYGSDKRLFHLMETLVGLGHDVTLAGMHVSGLESPFDRSRIKSLGVHVYEPLAEGSSPRVHALGAALKTRGKSPRPPHYVIMPLWFWQAVPVPDVFSALISSMSPNSRQIILSDDVHYLRQKMLVSDASPDVEKNIAELYAREYGHYRSPNISAVWTITHGDLDRMLQGDKNASSLKDKCHVIRYSVSNNEIIQHSVTTRPSISLSFELRHGLVFVGNGANPTNQAALEWFLLPTDLHSKSIFERVRDKVRDTGQPPPSMTVVGADWDFLQAKVADAGGNLTDMFFPGLLPSSDLTLTLTLARVFVSPVCASTGLNTKNILALSRGIPLVTTPTGAEGLCEASSGLGLGCEGALEDALTPQAFLENLRSSSRTVSNRWEEATPSPPFLVASSDIEFVTYVSRLYTRKDLWMRVSASGTKHVAERFSLTAQSRDLDQALWS